MVTQEPTKTFSILSKSGRKKNTECTESHLSLCQGNHKLYVIVFVLRRERFRNAKVLNDHENHNRSPVVQGSHGSHLEPTLGSIQPKLQRSASYGAPWPWAAALSLPSPTGRTSGALSAVEPQAGRGTLGVCSLLASQPQRLLLVRQLIQSLGQNRVTGRSRDSALSRSVVLTGVPPGKRTKQGTRLSGASR